MIGMALLGCQVLFGRERGEQVRVMMEAANGGPCPCSQGRTCPLMPTVEPEPPDVAEAAV